jgi:hypothetical protein
MTASDARTSGKTTPLGPAQSLSKGSQLAAHDSSGDTMGNRDDLFEVPGQMSTC